MSVASSAVRLAVLLLLASCSESREGERSSSPPEKAPAEVAPVPAPRDVDPAALRAFAKVPTRFDSAANAITDDKVALGRLLYHDVRLSLGQDISCNNCHDLQKHGVDGRRVSLGHRGQQGVRNSPTVFNAAGLVAQFWDGRAADVEEQAKGPILNPKEMAMPDAARVMAVVRSIPGYPERFARAFPGETDPVTFDNLARAIGAFERTLATPSRFDRLLDGQTEALTVAERSGLREFVDAGCPSCHSGAMIGGASFQKLGLVAPYEGSTDAGRFDVTHQEADRGVFRVSSLRNVTVTGPYFHDGNVADLPTAVRTMARIQLGRDLTTEQVDSIVVFLASLTGEPDAAAVQPPEPLPSGPRTPRPPPT